MLSATQYATTFGAMNIGQQYTLNGFTVTLTKTSTPPTPPTPPTAHYATAVSVGPVYQISVSPDAPTDFIVDCTYGGASWVMFLDASDDLQHMNVAFQPFFNITDMSVYPPYSNPEYGSMLFKFAERSNYHNIPCYFEDELSFSNHIPSSFVDEAFGCYFQSGLFSSFSLSLSFSFSSFFSLSLDQANQNQP
eukprot:CAMPEP_0206196998 /NCGR_PEP_ID=MMETSP0166-20121206/8774_1 /ASSEMBLY_ACC=CAM_ASM_000260 /TAXON_ID=95228 /ORGANISM="Vannella robusta, Strain DIVA3 518/3/11/1/6" /LENGTH=191 /DNA_ID=CAMNT_0053614565 /DNA_START=513 /DNA_END=1085 /DNA_ORIENTATION=-